MQLPEGLHYLLHGLSDQQGQDSPVGATPKGSSWAGASHWRYHAAANVLPADHPANSKAKPSRK